MRFVSHKDAFWLPGASGAHNGTSVGAGAFSAIVRLAEPLNQMAIYVTSSGATVVTLQVALPGEVTSEGVGDDTVPSTFYDLSYLDGPILTITFAGGASRALMVPDVSTTFMRLKNTTAGVNLTAGYAGYLAG